MGRGPPVPDTRFFKVIARLEDGTVAVCTAVEHQGQIWIVPNWIVPKWMPLPDKGYATPERMILLAQFRHERSDPPEDGPDLLDGADFRLLDPIPRALFDGALSSALREKFVVLEQADLRFRIADKRR
jgi:hypothetical protein